MSSIERLLVPGCTDLPECRCRKEMHLANIDPLPATKDAHIRVYRCAACDHEMRLTVWTDFDRCGLHHDFGTKRGTGVTT